VGAAWALGAVGALGAVSACGPDHAGAASSDNPVPSATAASTGPAPSSGPVPALVPGSLLHAPLGCPNGIGVLVLQRLGIRLAHDYTAVVARCDSAAGSPPTGVYVVAGDGAAASLAQTLVNPAQQLEVSALTATGTGVEVVAAGYSRADVPRCCPDVTVTLTWRAAGDRLVPVS
jgi:hypothetical protein